MRRTFAAAAAAALLVLAAGAAAPAHAPHVLAQDATTAAEDREWNQAGGGPTRACSSTVAPVRAPPVVAWRHQLPGEVLADPVAWGGVVYVVAQNKRGRDLLAFRASTGERVGWKQLGEGGKPSLGVWQGTAIVGDADRIRGFPIKLDGFAMGGWAQPTVSRDVTIVSGVALTKSAAGVIALNAQSGRPLGTVASGFGWDGPLLAVPHSRGFTVLSPFQCTQKGYADWFLSYAIANVTGDARNGLAWDSDTRHVSDLTMDVSGEIAWAAWFPPPGAAGARTGWMGVRQGMFFACGGPKYPTSTNEHLPGGCIAPSRPWPSKIGTRPAALKDRVYGFSPQGELISMDFEGRYQVLVDAKSLPAGARPGPATIVQNVLCFGNWAVDVDTRRVLWCLPGLVPASQAIPVTDGRIVVATDGGELVCLADPTVVTAPAPQPSAAPGAAAPKPGTKPAAAAPVAKPRAPEALEGVVLSDGTRVDGKPEAAADGTIRVTPAQGEARSFPADEVSIAVAAGAVVHRGAEFGALAAWRDVLEDEAVDAYCELFRKASSESLLETARGCLAKARKFGIDDARAEQLDRLLTGKNEHPNANLKTGRFAATEEEALAKLETRAIAASAWLAERGMPTAATAILEVALRPSPARPKILERAAALVPEAFPFPRGPQAGRLWLEWAVAILPAGGAFCSKDEPVWGRLAGEPAWKDGTLALRTRNLVFFTRNSDAAVVGACLRNGEGAIRALDTLFMDGRRQPVDSDRHRLEVRLHANKKDYMDERRPAGGGAMSWSAGYYSPSENISRFFVPGDHENDAARGRSLFKVLAHELTHHYIEQRYMNGMHGSAVMPGYWVVEGIARFVDDQAVEMGLRGLRFDDATADSLDTAAQLDLQNGLLLPLGRYLDMSQAEFHGLSPERKGTVKLRNTLGSYEIGAIDVFYDQGGSLCFWLMHRRGPEGRAALLAYLRAFYSAKTTRNGWRLLGFEGSAEMEREFRAFLATLRR